MTDPTPVWPGPSSVLLVSPSLQGHRLIYCRVLAGVFARAGHEVVVAGDVRDAGVADHPLLADLSGRPGVDVVDAGPAEAFTAAALPGLVRDAGAGVLFCAEADRLIGDPAFTPGAREALRGARTLALYVRSTNHQYGAPASWWRRARERLTGETSPAVAFHERGPADAGPVDAALVLDERFAATHAATHRWMPDIYRELEAPAGEHEETVEWRARLAEFLARAPRRPVVAYAGTNQERRGYDTLLRLAVDEEAAFVHCGRLDADDGPGAAEVERLRAVLRERGALLETAAPYVRPETADEFLRAARCVVLPYRQHDGSSGVMLQALAAGRPVLVPDRGLMAFRARSFGLGATYPDGDDAALRAAFRAACERRPELYAARLRAFTDCFAPERLEAAISAALTGSGPGAELPQQALAASPGGGEAA